MEKTQKSKFDRLEKALLHKAPDKMFFMSKEREKDWNEMESKTKEALLNSLTDTLAKLEKEVIFDFIDGALKKLDERLRALESWKEKQTGKHDRQ